MRKPPLRSTSRVSRAVIANWRQLVALSALVGTALTAGTVEAAPPGDDWSLEHQGDDPALVSQRMSKLRRNPLDGPQWRALTKSLGIKRLAAKIDALAARVPDDVALQILKARATAALGDPAAAAQDLAALSARASKHHGAVFWLRVDMLQAADQHAEAIAALEASAAKTTGARADKALARALSIADSAGLTQAAHRLARALSEAHPDSADARLRLARAATRAGDTDAADRAYGQALAKAPARQKNALTAERARARLDTDNPSGAAALVWTLLKEPKRGGKTARDGWWDLLADAHRRDGSTATLIRNLTRWLEGHPKDASGWRVLAGAQEASGMDALDAWHTVVELSPKDKHAHAALVEALEQKGDIAAALAEYERLAARDPSELELGLALAGRLVSSGQRELGLELAREIEGRIGRKARPMMALLDFYNLNDEPGRALSVAERIAAAAPRNPEARIALGEQLYQMHQMPEALKQWAKLPKLIRPAHAGWARHAEVLSEHGRVAEAITSLNKALKTAPDRAKYVRLRAVLAEDQRRPGTALGLWQQVRRLARRGRDTRLADEARTRVVELLVGGSVSQRRQKIETEIGLARQTLDKRAPKADAIEAGLFLAELHTRRENYAGAVSVQQELLQLDPDNPDRLAELATAQRRAGAVESALQTLEELLASQPGRSADVLAEMSELAFEAGDGGRALDAASRAAAADHAQVDALVHLGELQEREGDPGAARKAYRAALEIDKGNVRARLRLAELSLTLGEVDQSADAFREILELGGPPELLKEAGRRALDLAEADGATLELVELAVQRTALKPEATEPRTFLLEALQRADPKEVAAWLDAGGDAKQRAARQGSLRQPLVAALTRGSVGARVAAAGHLGWLNLPDTAVPLARMGATLTAPRDATATVRDAFDRARVTAIRAAGELRDPAAIGDFASVMGDASLSPGARHAAAWALAQSDEPKAAKALMDSRSWGLDPLIASLGCIAIAGQDRDTVDTTHAKSAARQARESRNLQVRHACTLAEASLTPDHRWTRLSPLLRSSDPVIAAIGAWRLGRMTRPPAEAVQAVVGVVIGPAGLPRDAAASALARLVTAAGGALPPSRTLPGAPRSQAWSSVIARWIEAQVTPEALPITTRDLEVYAPQIGAALDVAATGTRAERAAAEAVLTGCPGTPKRPTPGRRLVCLQPLLDIAVAIPPATTTEPGASGP